MFGRKWEPAEGTFVDVGVKRFGPGDNAPIVRYFLMDIRPSAGEPFRTEVREPLMTSGSLSGPTVVGEVVKLECDPRGKKARFHGDPAKQMDHVQALQAEGEHLEAQERRESAECRGSRDD
jgi:hypothetical protein